MRTLSEIYLGVECCVRAGSGAWCRKCPYNQGNIKCTDELREDLLEVIRKNEELNDLKEELNDLKQDALETANTAIKNVADDKNKQEIVNGLWNFLFRYVDREDE